MKPDRTIVRASDLGLWAYCHRAWWLARAKGAPHRNPAVLQRGTAIHAQHGSGVRRAQTVRRAALWMLAAALFLAGIFVIVQVFGLWR